MTSPPSLEWKKLIMEDVWEATGTRLVYRIVGVMRDESTREPQRWVVRTEPLRGKSGMRDVFSSDDATFSDVRDAKAMVERYDAQGANRPA